jgi:hypothetical protein
MLDRARHRGCDSPNEPCHTPELGGRSLDRLAMLNAVSSPSQLTPLSLRLSETTSYAEWACAGRQLARISHGIAWALGDWLLYGQAHYSSRYRDALAASQLDYQTLRNYAWVARSVPLSRRRDTLSFQHHAEVASLPDVEQELWLGRAERLRWSRNQLRRELAERPAEAHTQPPTAVIVRVAVAVQRERRWRQAASESAQGLEEWLADALDCAADAVLDPSSTYQGVAKR